MNADVEQDRLGSDEDEGELGKIVKELAITSFRITLVLLISAPVLWWFFKWLFTK